MNKIIYANITKSDKTTKGENPMATSLMNLITRSRIDQIAQLSDQLELDRNYVSKKKFGLIYDELSNAGADDVIAILKEMKEVSERVH